MVIKKLFVGSLILLAGWACQEDRKPSFPSDEAIAMVLDEKMAQSDLPAVVAIAVNKKGEKAKYAHGPAVWGEEEPVSTEHIFRIASMTKLITSIAALQMVEAGKIGLDDDLSILMPEMMGIPILSDGELVEPKDPITLRHLLTHTAGFGYFFTDEALANFDRKDWEYQTLPRRFESGTKFLYGRSTDWAGKVVEKLSGLSLEDYFRKNITGPLKMNQTWYNVPDSLTRKIVSQGRRGTDGTGALEVMPGRVPQTKVITYNGGGGLFSSPEDYTKLLLCLLNDGKYDGGRLLSRKMIAEMFENQIGDKVMDIEHNYFQEGFCCDFKGLIKKSSKWGLAFLIDNEGTYYGRKAGTALWGGLYNTYFYIDRQSGIAASIYTQHLPFNHSQTITVFEKFSELIYSKK